jgi:hypothetical protein
MLRLQSGTSFTHKFTIKFSSPDILDLAVNFLCLLHGMSCIVCVKFAFQSIMSHYGSSNCCPKRSAVLFGFVVCFLLF